MWRFLVSFLFLSIGVSAEALPPHPSEKGQVVLDLANAVVNILKEGNDAKIQQMIKIIPTIIPDVSEKEVRLYIESATKVVKSQTPQQIEQTIKYAVPFIISKYPKHMDQLSKAIVGISKMAV